MKQLRVRVARHRSAWLGVALAAVALTAALVLPTDATAVSCGTAFAYYSDASYTELVGAVAYTPKMCGCARFAWGTVTAYLRIDGMYCLPPPI
jgi:hypothetical protein